MQVCEHMRRAVRRINIRHSAPQSGLLTISLGSASTIPQTRGKPQELVAAADSALYQAKDMGRDRAVAA